MYKKRGGHQKGEKKGVRNHAKETNALLSGVLLFGERRTTITTATEDIYYVFPERAMGFVHGDTVLFEITRRGKEGKLSEARPTRLLKRSREKLLMEIRERKGRKQYTLLEEFGGLSITPEIPLENGKVGDIFTIIYNESGKVEILNLFAKYGDPDGEERILLFRHGVRLEWPEKKFSLPPSPPLPKKGERLKSFNALASSLKLKERSIFDEVVVSGKKRLDFRHWRTMTIDGSDAQDLDDAISISRYEDGDFLLGVHIADVAEYVEAGSSIDHEAYLRGTSVYTPGRVIPMLPEILSNDRCSLHPGEPKLTLSILMRVDSIGQVKDSYITEGVIESIEKGIYEDVWRNIQPLSSLQDVGMHGDLRNFYSLYTTLAARRKKEGKILFETTECYFELDSERNVKAIKKRERNTAHLMIEEFMVLANEEVAKWCVKHSLPFLSRIHSLPGEEQRRFIAEVLEAEYLREKLTPHHIRDHLERARDSREQYRLSRLLLPKMSKAYYGEKPERHFGLALSYYAHFTSPIRRYPDLLLHRIIKESLSGSLDLSKKQHYMREMKKWGKSLSEKERKAEEAERSIDALMMCRYMSDKVRQSYEGIISGLTESNIYVELPSGVEGSIYLGNMVGKFTLDPIRGALLGKEGKILHQIGQSIQVQVREVDMKNRRIELYV